MTDVQIIDAELIDQKATAWLLEVAPKIFEQLEKAQIHYDEELMCSLLVDGFKIGYATAIRDARNDKKTYLTTLRP